MSGSADRKMSHRDLVHLLKRRPRMSRLIMASLSATLVWCRHRSRLIGHRGHRRPEPRGRVDGSRTSVCRVGESDL